MDETIQSPGVVSRLRRRLGLIGAITAGGTAAVCLTAAVWPVRYTAKAQVIVEQGRTTLAAGGAAATEGAPDQSAISTELAILTSYDLLEAVGAQLSTDPEYRALRAGAPGQGVGGILGRLVRGKDRTSDPPISKPPIPPRSDTQSVEELRRDLEVYQEAGSHVIAVAYSSPRAEIAAVIANKIAHWYVEQREAKRQAPLDQALAGVTSKLTELRADTGRLEAAANAYQAARGLTDPAKASAIEQRMGDLNRQLAEARSNLTIRETRLRDLAASRGPAGDWAGVLNALDQRGLADLHGQIEALLQSRRDGIVAVYRPDQGRGTGANEPAARAMREKLRGELDQAVGKLTNDATAARSRVSELRDGLRSMRDTGGDMQLRALTNAAAAARQRYENLLRHHDDLVMQRDGLTPAARVLSRAPVPDRPSSSNPWFFVPPGALAFLGIGCLVALARDRSDHSLRAESDVAAALGIKCAGLVPALPPLLGGRSIGNAAAPVLAAYAESLRSILISLRLVGAGERTPKVIVVTSSLPGEGKTLLAASLGVLASRSGARVLLLDLGSREGVVAGAVFERAMPMVYKALGPERLVSRLQDPPANASGSFETRRGLSAGGRPIFSREQAESALQTLRGEYDLIVIDTACALLRAETRLLAAVADRVLFAVRWGKTAREEARNALSLLLGSGNVNPGALSVVLTQVDFRRHALTHRGDQAEALSKYAMYYSRSESQS